MRIIYPDHAITNISERHISKHLIADALKSPDKIIPSRKGRQIAHKMIGNRLLRVIFKPKTKAYIVVTAYFTDSLRYK